MSVERSIDLSLLAPVEEEEKINVSQADTLQLRKLEEELNSLKQDREERKSFANKIFWLLVAFLSASLIILSLSAIETICFKLSDTILVTLLATTSADIIGIFLFVVRYLFKANVCHRCGASISTQQTIKI